MQTLWIALVAACCFAAGCGGARGPARVIFDTDIQGDVDDVGAVAMLHALADAGEAELLAMGVSAKHPACVPCLDALNTYFRRPEIPLGVVKGEGFLRDSKYARQIAGEFPHRIRSADEVPDAALLYRRVLADQPDRSVVMISVGQLTNVRNLLNTRPDTHSDLNGVDLVRQKVKLWVCMGGKFPAGREANLINDGPAAAAAIANWPTPIVFSGFEIGRPVLTGGRLKQLPSDSPVRRAYALYKGLRPHHSWDQTAVLYGIRGLGDLWDLKTGGHCHVSPDGANEWRKTPDKNHARLVEKAPPRQVADAIEVLMLHQPMKKRD